METRDILAAKLRERGWTQELLAQQAGVSQGQVSRILNGQRQHLRLETLRAIAKALGCRTIDLLPPEDH